MAVLGDNEQSVRAQSTASGPGGYQTRAAHGGRAMSCSYVGAMDRPFTREDCLWNLVRCWLRRSRCLFTDQSRGWYSGHALEASCEFWWRWQSSSNQEFI